MAKHDLIVIGAGPGGYVAAIRAAQLGLNVACVDKNEQLGGTCLRVGCIPSKAMLESSHKFHELESLNEHGIQVDGAKLDLNTMLARKDGVVKANTDGIDFLFKKNKITRYFGYARFNGTGKIMVEDANGAEAHEADKVIIATGSKAASLPFIDYDGERIGTSTEALAYSEVPEHLIVIGAGYIGLELGSVWQRLGAKVTVVEYLERILPGMDAETAKEALKVFKKQGIGFMLGSNITSVKVDGNSCIVDIEGKDSLTSDRVLVAAGRKPNTDFLGLETIGLEPNERGFISVDDSYKTSADGVYAIGDVIGGAMLAHKAEEEGIACVEKMVTGYGHVNYGAIPGIVYTDPEIATVGKTEEELKESGTLYNKGSFPFQANGRARAINNTVGKVKVLADATTDRVLGVHIIGPHAGDLIAEAVSAIEFGASAEDIARTSHAHPTLSEVVKEAALAVDKRAIHI